MESDIQDEIFSFKQDLLGSRNYYSELWGRYRLLQVLFFVVEAVTCLLVVKCSDLNGFWTRAVLFLGVTLSTFKYINVLPQRVKDLGWQYHECQDIVNCLEKDQSICFDGISKLRDRFGKIEKKDVPTIECLMAVCRNKALVALGVNKKYQMTWFERHIGIFCSWVKYDEHARLVEVE